MDLSTAIAQVVLGIYGFLLFAQLVKMIFPNIDIPLGSEEVKEGFCWGVLISVVALIAFYFLVESGLSTFLPALNFDWLPDYLKDLLEYLENLALKLGILPDLKFSLTA